METLNQTKAEAFAQRMLDILNSGALALMTSRRLTMCQVCAIARRYQSLNKSDSLFLDSSDSHRVVRLSDRFTQSTELQATKSRQFESPVIVNNLVDEMSNCEAF